MVALHTHGAVVDEMVVNHPTGVKAALGENPRRVHGDQKKVPSTRLGISYVLRQAMCDAQAYVAKRGAGTKAATEEPRDLRKEALAMVLAGTVPLRQHAHRADDIVTAIRIAEEFGYRLVIEHGTGAGRIAPYIAKHGVPVLVGPVIISRYKVEMADLATITATRLAEAGVEVSIITDHPATPTEYLALSAILSHKAGLPRDLALRAITMNPAKVLGLGDRLGSLTVGKDADLVLWSGDPLDVMSKVERVWIGGKPVFG